MKISSKRPVDDFEIQVISLIDVMLTLLMFFVMTATFEQRSLLKVTLPESKKSAATDMSKALIVAVDKQGRFFVGNNEVLNPNLSTLKSALEQAAGDDRNMPITLRADAQTQHQAVVTALDALGQLGFTHLTIATVPDGGEE